MVNTEKEKHKMLIAIIKWFTQLFSSHDQSDLDRYIAARNPANATDVEYLERQFNKINRGGLL